MKLILCKNSSDHKTLVKNIAEVWELPDIQIKEDTDILHPIFTFHKFLDSNNHVIWKNFNYCKLVWDGMPTRYYYVRTFTMQKGGILEIHCDIDERMTWSTYLLGQHYLVSRQEHYHNPMIPDERIKLTGATTLDVITDFTGGTGGIVGDGGDGSIILTVSG